MRYLIIFMFTSMLSWFSGCKNEEIPPPPVDHARLAKKMFRNLRRKQFDTAVKRIQKIKALSPNNDFLIHLEEISYCNNSILKAQKQLDANKIADALKTIDSARRKYPLNRNLTAIQNELNILSNIQGRIKILNSATSSHEMYSQIAAIKKFINTHPPARSLEPLLRKKVKIAFKTNLYEKERARFDLLCDLESARRAERFDESLNNTLRALLAADNAATVNKNERINPKLLD